jgi:hypothetical protein
LIGCIIKTHDIYAVAVAGAGAAAAATGAELFNDTTFFVTVVPVAPPNLAARAFSFSTSDSSIPIPSTLLGREECEERRCEYQQVGQHQISWHVLMQLLDRQLIIDLRELLHHQPMITLPLP